MGQRHGTVLGEYDGGVAADLGDRARGRLRRPAPRLRERAEGAGPRRGLRQQLRAALPELPHACGLGTLSLMAADVTAEPLRPVDGFLPVRDVAVDEALLTEHAVTGERRDWWLDRVRRTHAVLAAASEM